MKTFLPLLVVFTFFITNTNAQCTISSNTSASSLTCGVSPLVSCNGILYIGNGSTPITLLMDTELNLTCLGPLQVIVNNAALDFSPGNNRMYLTEGSSLTLINNSSLIGGSCNASERIFIGTNLLASCNGQAGADVSFSDITNLGGTGSLTSNSPVCVGNTINLSATSPPNNGPYTYSWFGPGLSQTSYLSSSTYSLTATSSGVYQVKMKSSSGIIMIAEITVTVNSGLATTLPSVSLVQTTCLVATGAINITGPLGTGMTYSIDGLNYSNTTGSFASIVSGTYNVTAKNSSGCISPATSVTINAQPTNVWDGTSWSNGTPTNSQKLIFSGDFSSTSDIVGCSCQIVSGNVVFNAGTTFTVTGEVRVTGGSLTFEDDASLVQLNTTSNVGSITYKRKTTGLKPYDYTYWSSPVVSATLSQLATNSLFYKYDPVIGDWVWLPSTTVMTPGVGYIARVSPNIVTGTILETNFIGVPNNGDISTTVKKSASAYNLIGNPYPSAVDADLFITDATNSSIITGTLYYWTHNTSITNNNYTFADYATYNLTGGVGTGVGTLGASRYIAAGQGFFVEVAKLQ